MNSQAHAKEKIKKLVEKYEQVLKAGQVHRYTEEDTKKDFILPLFEALGWDVNERTEVSSEEHIKSAGRVDYGFYLAGRQKFYLEAKPLKADLTRTDYADQAIKYSWNKGVTWAILTDFEGLKVFNAQDIERKLADKSYFNFTWDSYLEDFDDLWLLSKEAFQQDLLDKAGEKVGKKMQKVSVTVSLYKDLQKCREILTKSLSLWNKSVSDELIDEGVQKLLDRLIFLRVAEDRGVEPPTLLPLLRRWEGSKSKEHLYQSMIEKFRELDEIYNSNLFSEHPFEQWEEYDGATKKVIELLYGKAGYYEYDFKTMPADVLGTVYENYLGYKLQQSKKGLTVDKSARKRKEQGIYYTPAFVVDYIVRHALQPVLDKCREISDLKKIKVLDPACGSGSFLVKALDLINEKYREFGNPANAYTKLDILQNNIFGVDLDEQAVEIARLNLLISAFDTQIKLPFLNKNIKNGNSLISGTNEELEKHFGKNWRDKKPFNWHEEFPDVFKQGGFDVIVGNPPYIKEFINKSAFDGLHESPYYQGKMDIWTMFASVAIDLLKKGGTLSFIAPNNWISNAGASIFRDKILKDGELIDYVDFGDYKVFEQAGIQTMIFVFEKIKPRESYSINYIRVDDKKITEDFLLDAILNKKGSITLKPKKFDGKMLSFANSEFVPIFDKIQSRGNFKLLDDEVGQGIVAAPDEYFLVNDIKKFSTNEKTFLKKYYTAVGRYTGGASDDYILYISAKNFGGKKIDDFSNIKNHFEPHKKVLNEARIKYGTPDKPYFYLHRERDEKFFQKGPKVACGVRVARPSFFYTEEEYYGSRALNFIKTDRIDLKYLTGILNSRLVYFWLLHQGKRLGDLLQVDKGPLLGVPIVISDDKSINKRISSLVDEMRGLFVELHKTQGNSNHWQQLKDEIESIDRKIDSIIYVIYGVTNEDRIVIEKATE